MENLILNCKGLNCPLPIVQIGRELKKMTVGQVLEVEADDPAFKEDVMAFIRHSHQTIVSILEEGKVIKVTIRKEQ